MISEKTKIKIEKMILNILRQENRPLTLTEIKRRIKEKIKAVENLGSLIDQLLENNIIEVIIEQENDIYIPKYRVRK